jgi:hypothetical protein
MASNADMVKAAKAELSEGVSGRPNKYTKWYGMTDEWCGMFVAYCANKAGVSTSIIPKSASVSGYLSFAKNKSRFKAKDSGYEPKGGDIMIQKSNGASHVGIVIYGDKNNFTTIEGNSGDAVKKRSYSITNANLTGFFVPDYDEEGTVITEDTESGTSTSEKAELCSTTIKSVITVGGEIEQKKLYRYINDEENGIEIHIINKGIDYRPLVVSSIKWTTQWQDTAGKLEFSILKDSALDIQEGNAVIFRMSGTGVFYGYIFEKSRVKDGIIKITAYDQLRYLKNTDTYCYKARRYDEVLAMIAADHRLTLGTLENTQYVIPGRVRNDETLFDTLKDARELTKNATGIDYVLFDDFGELSIKSTDSLQTDYLLCAETAENFSYKSSIDDDVYNCIQLYRDDDSTGNREKYVFKDAETINKWGLLQTTYKLENGDNPYALGPLVLKALNQKKRELEVKGCFGDLRLRAGAKLCVNLDLGDVLYKNVNPIITKAVHSFNEQYTCDLTLLGGEPYIG